MISIPSPAPLTLELRASRLALAGFCSLAILAILLVPSVIQALERLGINAAIAGWLIVFLQCALAVYSATVCRRFLSVKYGNGLLLQLDRNGWRGHFSGGVKAIDVNCRYISPYLLVLRLSIQGRGWWVPVFPDQLSKSQFRILRRAMLHGRWQNTSGQH